MELVFWGFQRTDKMESVMKGLMGQCPIRTAPGARGLVVVTFRLQFDSHHGSFEWVANLMCA